MVERWSLAAVLQDRSSVIPWESQLTVGRCSLIKSLMWTTSPEVK